MATPHDRLFKATFSELEHARAELRCVLPTELSQSLDWDSLSLVSGEFVDPQLMHLHSDLLFTVQVRASAACVYLLFEHQSSADAAMPLCLLRYMTRIWERLDKDRPNERLPPIIPVVLAVRRRNHCTPVGFVGVSGSRLHWFAVRLLGWHAASRLPVAVTGGSKGNVWGVLSLDHIGTQLRKPAGSSILGELGGAGAHDDER